MSRLRTRAERIESAARCLLDEVHVPDSNCNCHILPPCADCVANGALRECVEDLRAALNIPAETQPTEVAEIKSEFMSGYSQLAGPSYDIDAIAEALGDARKQLIADAARIAR